MSTVYYDIKNYDIDKMRELEEQRMRNKQIITNAVEAVTPGMTLEDPVWDPKNFFDGSTIYHPLENIELRVVLMFNTQQAHDQGCSPEIPMLLQYGDKYYIYDHGWTSIDRDTLITRMIRIAESLPVGIDECSNLVPYQTNRVVLAYSIEACIRSLLNIEKVADCIGFTSVNHFGDSFGVCVCKNGMLTADLAHDPENPSKFDLELRAYEPWLFHPNKGEVLYDPDAKRSAAWEAFLEMAFDSPEEVENLRMAFANIVFRFGCFTHLFELSGDPQSRQIIIDVLRALMSGRSVFAPDYDELGTIGVPHHLREQDLVILDGNALMVDGLWKRPGAEAYEFIDYNVIFEFESSEYPFMPKALLFSHLKPQTQIFSKHIKLVENMLRIHVAGRPNSDPDLLDKLISELPAILNWSAAGLPGEYDRMDIISKDI